MRSITRRIGLASLLLIGGLTLFGAVPAGAHNYVEWDGNGCLHALHDNRIGSLAWNGSTCDHDNNWVGRVRDDHATSDGYCVRAVLDGIIMTVSCNSSGSGLQFHDPQENFYAWTCITETSGQAACADNYNF